MRRRPSLLVIAAVSAVAAGCGGTVADDRGAARPAAKPARTNFVADAKRVCARMEGRLARIGKVSRPPTDAQLLAIVDAWSTTLDELSRVEPPPTKAREFMRMLRQFRLAARAWRAVPETEGELALAPVGAMLAAGMEGAAAARRLGLEECSPFPVAPSQAEFERLLLEQARKEGSFPFVKRREAPVVRCASLRRDRRAARCARARLRRGT